MSQLNGHEVLVLLSGGIDSAACVDFYKDLGRPPCGFFVDYGQPAARLEAQAAKSVAAHYSIPLMSLKWHGCQTKHAGLIPGRNSFLIAAAVMERPPSISVIAIGVHSGTDYPDCSQYFLDTMQLALDASESRSLQLAAPFATWSKAEVVEYCKVRNVPLHLTYSCESGSEPPCGSCLSCKDRRSFLASTPLRA
jgi:7-cyano-7-deazaguanine synthase